MTGAAGAPAVVLPPELRERVAALATTVVAELSWAESGAAGPGDPETAALEGRLARRLARAEEVLDALWPEVSDDGPPGTAPVPVVLLRRLATEIGRMPRILFEGPAGRLWLDQGRGPTGPTLAEAVYVRERLLGLARAASREEGR